MLKIGIGCITYNRPKLIDKWRKQIDKHMSSYKYDIIIYIAKDTDSDRKGIAYRSNECLHALKDCDYIFLFNDDCYPVKTGWIDLYVQTFMITGEHHFLLLTAYHNCMYKKGVVEAYKECGGVMLFMTKACIEKVGYFYNGYGLYGYEHSGYSTRIHKAGLTSHPYLHIVGSQDYLYALDYDPGSGHKSIIEPRLKQDQVKNSIPDFIEDIKQVYRGFSLK